MVKGAFTELHATKDVHYSVDVQEYLNRPNYIVKQMVIETVQPIRLLCRH